MAIIVATIDPTGIITTIPPHPLPIYLWTTEQSITFVPGVDTSITGIVFGDGWPGAPAIQIIGGQWVADAGKPLPAGSKYEQYDVHIEATHLPTGTKGDHDPDIENHPQP